MSVTAPIPVTDISGQQTVNFPNTAQSYSYAKIIVNRSGTGGTHPWMNSLAATDTLQVDFQYSTDGGQIWKDLGSETLTGGSHVVKGITVPVTNEIGVGIGAAFPVGTSFRVIMTASTPCTFSGAAEYG